MRIGESPGWIIGQGRHSRRLLEPCEAAERGTQVPSTRRRLAREAINDVPGIVRLSLLLFAFSIPFETVDLGVNVTVSKVAGYVLLLVALATPRICFRPMPRALGLFILYVSIYAL